MKLTMPPHGSWLQWPKGDWNDRMDCSKLWSKEMSYEFAAYKLLMWPIGTWPLQRTKNFTKFRALLTSLLEIIMITNLLTEISRTQTVGMEVMLDYFGLIACGIVALAKILLIRVHRDHLFRAIECAADDWSFTANEDHRMIMIRHARRARMVFTFQVMSSSIVVSSMILAPLSLTAPSTSPDNATDTPVMYLPMGTQCVPPPKYSAWLCDVTYAFQAIQLTTTTMGNLGSDIFMFGIAMHLCGQFEVLREEISQFGVEKADLKYCRCTMINFVKRHNAALDLARNMKDTLNLILLVQLFLNSLHICLIGVQLILSSKLADFVLMIRALVSFNLLMVQLFLYSYIGESLTSKMETIGQAIYLSDWYTVPCNVVKDLHFVIARTRVPFYITAGSFYSMNFNNFKNILKASASYFSVLQIIINV